MQRVARRVARDQRGIVDGEKSRCEDVEREETERERGSKWERTKRRGEKVRSVSMAELQKTMPELAQGGKNWSQDWRNNNPEPHIREENRIGRKKLADSLIIISG